jgi:hypothetical protein
MLFIVIIKYDQEADMVPPETVAAAKQQVIFRLTLIVAMI